MSREFQPIIRVEGRTFAPPQPAAARPSPLEESDTTETHGIAGISEAAMRAAIESAEVSYPTRSGKVAKVALETAVPLLREASKKAGSLRVISIPEEIVEAAAEAIYSLHGSNWEGIGYRLRWIFRDDARLILEAAAPHIQFPSAFWDDLAEDLKDPEFAAEYAKTVAKIQKEQE